MNRNFLLLWYGQFVSLIGNQAFSIALMFWIKHSTGSASLMGFLMMVSMVPAVILGPIGGVIADRYSRRKIIILCDIVSGIAVLSLSALMFLIPDETTIILISLFVAAIIVAASSSIFSPAISAAIPGLVPKDEVNRANSLNQGSARISMFIGQGLGGFLYRVLGAPVLFLIDGLTYLVAALSESFVVIPQVVPESSITMGETYKQVQIDLKEGFHYVWNNGGLKVMVIVFAFLNFFSIPFIILLPFYVEDFLKIGSDWYGYFLATFGLGTLVGYIIVGIAKLTCEMKSKLIPFLLFSVSIALASLGFIRIAYVSLIVIFATGVMSGVINVIILTILQTSTPAEIRGRVFGLMATLTGSLSPIAMGLAGIAGDLTGNNIPLIFSVCGGGLTILSAIILINREFRFFVACENKS
jgi:MFS transporter, DHA3 family, macrolide efflux protein